MKILVIFTGGTIGSSTSGHLIDVDAKASYHLLQAYGTCPGAREVDFDTAQPIYILSENIVPGQWHALLDMLCSLDPSQYDGIVIAHGTNTLPYTAAALSFALPDCRLPVVLVSSNYTLDDERSNGLRNFASAVDFIAHGEVPGVFVVYENGAGESIVHLGSRLLEAVPFSDAFESVGGVPFGTMQAGRFLPNGHPCNPTLAELKGHRPILSGDVRFSSDIMLIRPFAGMRYDFSALPGKSRRLYCMISTTPVRPIRWRMRAAIRSGRFSPIAGSRVSMSMPHPSPRGRMCT